MSIIPQHEIPKTHISECDYAMLYYLVSRKLSFNSILLHCTILAACGDVNLTHEQATVNYTHEVRNGSMAVIGCKEGYTLYPSSVTLLCLYVGSEDSTGGHWHRQVKLPDGSDLLNSDYTYSCAKIQSPCKFMLHMPEHNTIYHIALVHVKYLSTPR